jgi:multiple sugar transport system ATP-binding protein
MTMGDRITVLKDGVIQQVDAPLKLYENPHNKFVAGFIGSPAMNFFEGELVQNGNLHFKSMFGDIKMPEKISSELKISAQQQVTLGVRPEHFSFKPISDQGEAQIEAKIDVIEPMGNELIIYLSKNNLSFILRADSTYQPAVNDIVKLYINLEKIHFFDSKTTESMIKTE